MLIEAAWVPEEKSELLPSPGLKLERPPVPKTNCFLRSETLYGVQPSWKRLLIAARSPCPSWWSESRNRRPARPLSPLLSRLSLRTPSTQRAQSDFPRCELGASPQRLRSAARVCFPVHRPEMDFRIREPCVQKSEVSAGNPTTSAADELTLPAAPHSSPAMQTRSRTENAGQERLCDAHICGIMAR